MYSSRLIKRGISTFVNEKSADILQYLEQLLPSSQVSVSESSRQHHSHDESHHFERLPDIVVAPNTVEEVSGVVKICNENKVTVIPFGTGTGLEGGVTAPLGGVCIDLMTMDKIVDFNQDDFDVTVQPGVTRNTLNSYLHDTGLWFTVDPGADASLCGMCATSASGTNAVRYGTMAEVVRNMEVVIPNGNIIHTKGYKRRAKKSSAGYNLTNLFIGSEGTLGIITAATLKLFPYPEKIASAVCSFQNIKQACDTVLQIFQCCVPMARIEFLDDVQIDACNKFSNLNYPVFPTLFLEFHGTEQEVNSQAEMVGEICESNEGSDFSWSILPEERDKLWKARHDAYYAALALKPNCKGYTTDVCVPVSNLADVLVETKKDIENSGLIGPIVGHVGDGNFHCIFVVDHDNEEEMNKTLELSDKIVKRALSYNGTCTGEHGIGLGKRHYLKDEFGIEALELMKTLKNALDPNNIMNPTKVLY